MTKPIVVWGDPPTKPPARPLQYVAWLTSITQVLAERPGEWACIQRNPKRAPLNAMRARLMSDAYKRVALPHHLELTVRRTPDGEDYGLWARTTPPGGHT